MKLALTVAVVAALLAAAPCEGLDAHKKQYSSARVKQQQHHDDGLSTKQFLSNALKHLNTVAPSSR